MRWSLIFLFLGLIQCAHSERPTIGLEDYDANSQAAGAAYVTDGMNLRKPMPSRPEWKPFPFYYKHCTEIGKASFYSKTSYMCTGLDAY